MVFREVYIGLENSLALEHMTLEDDCLVALILIPKHL